MAKGKKTGGRQKGTPNKIAGSIKQAVLDTFNDIGGIRHMKKWAKKQPTEFYRLAGRLIPTETKVQGAVTFTDLDALMTAIDGKSRGLPSEQDKPT
jgi:hypothetical protein